MNEKHVELLAEAHHEGLSRNAAIYCSDIRASGAPCAAQRLHDEVARYIAESEPFRRLLDGDRQMIAALREELSLLMAHTAVSSKELRIEAVVRAQRALDDTKAVADERDRRLLDGAREEERAGIREAVEPLRELADLRAKASAGPWKSKVGADALVYRPDGSHMNIGDAIYHPKYVADAAFIAAAGSTDFAAILDRALGGRSEQP